MPEMERIEPSSVIDVSDIRLVQGMGAGFMQALATDGTPISTMAVLIRSCEPNGDGQSYDSPYYVFGMEEMAYFIAGLIEHAAVIDPDILRYAKIILNEAELKAQEDEGL